MVMIFWLEERESDTLQGGRGNDRYDGRGQGDTILETTAFNYAEGTLINNDDIISGGEGDDYIISGEGADSIQGGPGEDEIYPNSHARDFYIDTINCGAEYDTLLQLYSGDGDTATNCEAVRDFDG